MVAYKKTDDKKSDFILILCVDGKSKNKNFRYCLKGKNSELHNYKSWSKFPCPKKDTPSFFDNALWDTIWFAAFALYMSYFALIPALISKGTFDE